jgi:sugar O-acyltransferase (sialic acid O-acetyltransferase NeuD family)
VAELLILGSSGLAKEMAHLARAIDPDARRWQDIAYVTHDPSELGRELLHGRVRYLDGDVLARRDSADAVVGVGHPGLRRRLAARFGAVAALHFPTLVHPSVTLSASVHHGRGNAITQGVALTCDIVLGDFNLLNLNTTVGHDVRMGHWNVVNPGCNLSGGVTLGDACLLGTGSQVLEGRSLVSGTVLGAGAVLTRDAAEPATWVGLPARPMAAPAR